MAKKTSSGVIAVIAIFVLCIIFPRSVWGYVIFVVGLVWVYQALLPTKQSEAAGSYPTKANKDTRTAQTQMAHGVASVSSGEDSRLSSPKTTPPSQSTVPTAQRRFVEESSPVLVATKTISQSKDFAIPPAPAQAELGPGRWIPPGESVVVAGTTIDGGMIYVGKTLKAYAGTPDPCLINPALRVAPDGDASERGFGYWPSYSDIAPTARRAYLSWLAGGRSDPDVDIGYVFLFFYGLERRAIVDGKKDEHSQRDHSAIAQELRRLLGIYGEKSHSFKRYAGELLNWLEVLECSRKLYEEPVPSFPLTFEVPLYVRLALGFAAVDRVPVPGHLALAWVRLDPTSYLRTCAFRCVEQFNKLFLQRYAEAFKPGIILPHNKTRLKFVYQPASAGFRSVNEIKLGFGDTPDVTVLTAPQKQLKKVVDEVSELLDSYSRYVGRNPEAQNALEGLLLLPPAIWPQDARDALKDLQDRVATDVTVLKMQELLDLFQAKVALNKERALALAGMLNAVHIGIEPDILGGARTPKGDNYVVLYAAPEPDAAQARTSAYQVATLTLQLASAVASADGDFGEHELEHLREQVQTWSYLTPGESARMLAHLRLLVVEPVSLASLKKRLELLDVESKETIAALMATVAQADGSVTPAEVKMLEKVYKTLGIDAKRVFTDVHAVATGASPKPRHSTVSEDKGFQLDATKIAALQKDSERVSVLLADIFKEESPPSTPIASLALEPQEAEIPATGLFGLDEPHSAFARMLLSRPKWTRAELLDVSSDLDLMLDGALEHINEFSFDTYDIPFTEGDDPIEVNAEILEKLES